MFRIDSAETVDGVAEIVILMIVVLIAKHDIPTNPETWLQVGDAEKAIEGRIERSK